jgi:hypothetical protein
VNLLCCYVNIVVSYYRYLIYILFFRNFMCNLQYKLPYFCSYYQQIRPMDLDQKFLLSRNTDVRNEIYWAPCSLLYINNNCYFIRTFVQNVSKCTGNIRDVSVCVIFIYISWMYNCIYWQQAYSWMKMSDIRVNFC